MNKQTKDIVKSIVKSPQWSAFELVAEEIIKKIEDDPVLKDTQFETIKAICLKEGMKKGIRRFINQLREYANVR